MKFKRFHRTRHVNLINAQCSQKFQLMCNLISLLYQLKVYSPFSICVFANCQHKVSKISLYLKRLLRIFPTLSATMRCQKFFLGLYSSMQVHIHNIMHIFQIFIHFVFGFKACREGSNFLCAMENENIFPVDILRKIAVFFGAFQHIISSDMKHIWRLKKKYSFLLFWQELPNANP